MSCPACDRAVTHPRSGIYAANCRGCEVRAIAQSPKHIREQAYAQQPEEMREQFKADVLAEFKRISPGYESISSQPTSSNTTGGAA